jgi:probable rRNA maturation factor
MPRSSVRKNPQPEPTRTPPALEIVNRQRRHRFDLAYIRRLAQAALPLCLAEAGPEPHVLADLEEVTVSIVSPTAMSRVHVDFLGIEGPTDVITFPYGEILVCAEIAAENAARYDVSLDDELALYVIHGLLHLNGFDDLSAGPARQMRARQAKVLNTVRKSR